MRSRRARDDSFANETFLLEKARKRAREGMEKVDIFSFSVRSVDILYDDPFAVGGVARHCGRSSRRSTIWPQDSIAACHGHDLAVSTRFELQTKNENGRNACCRTHHQPSCLCRSLQGMPMVNSLSTLEGLNHLSFSIVIFL